MLDFIRRWRFSRQRNLFPYWDGRRTRKGDPVALLRSLHEDDFFNWEVHPQMIKSGDADAIRICADAARRAFGVPSFEDGGLTDIEALTLFSKFVAYISAVKKNTKTSLMSLPPTAKEPTGATETATSMSDSSA